MLVTLVSCLLGCLQMHAQDDVLFRDLMEKSKMRYESLGDYQIDTFYKLFQLSDLNNNSSKEEYNGLYAKNGRASYSKIGPIEFISQKGVLIQINHELLEIYYTKIGKGGSQPNPIDMSQFASVFKNVRVQETSEGWLCELMKPYDINKMPYLKVVIKLDRNHLVVNQEMYPTKVISFAASDNGNIADRAVLHVKLSLPKKIIDKKIFDIGNYVTQQGNNLIPIQGFEKYELIKV